MTEPRTFRKKPVEIQAMQVLDDLPSVTAIADWIVANGGSCTSPLAFHERRETALRIKTLEGVMDADLGDWIIRGVKGEFYPCKPDIFEQTYVDAAAAPPAEATPGAVLPVTYHETEIENVTEVEYDQGLYQAVDEAVRKAAWHSSSSKDLPWVDGYSADFTGAVLHALNERFVIVPRGDNHG
jgi:hypothetical protein